MCLKSLCRIPASITDSPNCIAARRFQRADARYPGRLSRLFGIRPKGSAHCRRTFGARRRCGNYYRRCAKADWEREVSATRFHRGRLRCSGHRLRVKWRPVCACPYISFLLAIRVPPGDLPKRDRCSVLGRIIAHARRSDRRYSRRTSWRLMGLSFSSDGRPTSWAHLAAPLHLRDS